MSVSYMATSLLSAISPNPFWRTKVQRPVCRRPVWAAATLGSQSMKALGAPVEPPILMAETVDFVPPPLDEPLRVRRAAHKLDKEYVAKFKEGLITGNLIRDPTLALPYWSWDTPEGMRMPKITFHGKPLLLAKSFHQMLLAVLRLYTTLCTCGLGQAQNPTATWQTSTQQLGTSLLGSYPEFKQNDWLEASFIFYDENCKLSSARLLELNPNLGMRFCLLGLRRDERLFINGIRVDPNPNLKFCLFAPQSIEK
ncbi:hypothetical protein AAG906_027027 [Vitis piasezkii]